MSECAEDAGSEAEREVVCWGAVGAMLDRLGGWESRYGGMLIRRLKVSGLLSFGPRGVDLPMEALNVLIGANGSESPTCWK